MFSRFVAIVIFFVCALCLFCRTVCEWFVVFKVQKKNTTQNRVVRWKLATWCFVHTKVKVFPISPIHNCQVHIRFGVVSLWCGVGLSSVVAVNPSNRDMLISLNTFGACIIMESISVGLVRTMRTYAFNDTIAVESMQTRISISFKRTIDRRKLERLMSIIV